MGATENLRLIESTVAVFFAMELSVLFNQLGLLGRVLSLKLVLYEGALRKRYYTD